MPLVFWGGSLVAAMLFVFVFKSVLLPFILGMAVAYLLNPLVNALGAVGFSRAPSALMILGAFLIVVLAFIGVISPIVYREFAEFSRDLPVYVEKVWAMLAPLTARLKNYTGGDYGAELQALLKNNSSSAVGVANYVVQKIASGGQAVVDMVTVAVFMPVVAYFMMKEWPSITVWLRHLIPRHSEGVVMSLWKQIDQKLSGFVRGQISVAFILGVGYAVALALAGLKYGFLIGLAAGLLSVIPMVGSAVGLVIGVAVAWFQAGDIGFVLLIAGIFIAGQLIEGNFLTPKLVGDSVGLHPLWVFFALLAGGSLLGILGMFLAVPVAAVASVFIAFGLKRYKESAYYWGSQDQETRTESGDKQGKTKE